MPNNGNSTYLQVTASDFHVVSTLTKYLVISLHWSASPRILSGKERDEALTSAVTNMTLGFSNENPVRKRVCPIHLSQLRLERQRFQSLKGMARHRLP